MTIETLICEDSYVADGTTNPRNIGFPVADPSYLTLEVDGVSQTLGTHYIIDGDYSAGLGRIVPQIAWADGAAVHYYRVTRLMQGAAIPAGKPLPSRSLEAQLDRDVMRIQEIGAMMSRMPTIPRHGEVDGLFPVVGPGRTWAWASGTGADGALRQDIASETDGLGSALMSFRRPPSLPAAPSVERKLYELPLITDFGAKGDYNGSEGTDDTAAFQYCIDNDISARVPMDRNFLIEGVLELRPNFSLIGDDYPAASDDVTNFPTSRLVFAGSGRPAMVNADPTQLLNKCAISSLVLTTKAGSQLEYLMDVHGMLGGHFMWLSIENSWANGGGIRSTKVTGQPSWLQRIVDVNIKIPDNSSRETLDCDWTDSEILGGNFSGGKGAFFRGEGNIKALGVQFERGKAGYAGLTLSKETISNGEIPIIGCSFDNNFGPGLRVNSAFNPGGSIYGAMILGCVFRNPDADYDIVFDPVTAAPMQGPVVDGCVFSASGTVPMQVDPTKWDVSIGDNFYADATWLPSLFTNGNDLLRILGRNGINLRGPLAVRDSRTFRSMTNVAALFGINLDDAAAVLAGVRNGNQPYVASSRTAAGVATHLALVTDNVDRVLIPKDGIANYADDAAAAAGGVPVLGLYRTGSALKIRVA